MRKLIIKIVLVFCALLSVKVSAQLSSLDKEQFYFDQIDVNDGLSQSSALSIYQDDYGFMWFGTRDGLNKYDGYTVEVFRHKVNDSLSISGNIINDIDEDADNNIWVASQNGLSRYNRAAHAFKNYFYSEGKYASAPLNDILVDSKNHIWAGGEFGLAYFDTKKETFSTPSAIENYINSESKFTVNSIIEDIHGNLWIGTNNFEIFKFNFEKNELVKLNNNPDSKFSARVEALIILPNNELWVGTYGEGLFLMDHLGNIKKHYDADAPKENKIANNNIRALTIDNDENIWVGTFDGLTILDKHGNPSIIKHEEGNLKGLSHNSIRSLLKDKKGSVWIGTYFGGINIFDSDNQRFKHFYNSIRKENSLSYNVVGAFSEDAEHNIFIGTERGGLNIYDSNKNQHLKASTANLQLSTIKSLYTDKNDNLWAGIFRQGLNLLDEKQQKFISFPTVNQQSFQFLKNAIINCIIEDDGQNLWIGTDAKRGVHKFNLNTKEFVNFPHQKKLIDILGNASVKSILITTEGQLIIATKGKGVLVFNPFNGIIKTINKFKVDDHVINIDEFNHVYQDSKGIIWMASNGSGAIAYNVKEDSYLHFHSGNDLGNNIVFGTLEDANGAIWLITLNGVSKVGTFTNGIIKNYTNASGFPLGEINEGAFYKTSDGKFLVGGNNGYVTFDPGKLTDNSYIPEVVLTGLSISNKKVYPDDGSRVLSKEINQTKKITLTYLQSVLTLEFAALSYLKLENNHYAYKLEGFDEKWVFLPSRQGVTYTNLKSGNYTFLVKGSNNDGIWNENPLRLEIEVLPPPWKTWWAYLLYIIFILLGFYIIRHNAIKSTQLKHSLKIEQLEKEKWKEVHDLKLKYFIDVSHEFRTPLTLILGPLEELTGLKMKKQEVRSLIKIMYFNAKRLLLLIDQILEIREIETGHSKLNEQPVYITWLTQEILDSFKMLADKKQIKLSLQTHKLPDVPTLVDRDKVEKIIFNLLSNAFKYTNEGGQILIKVSARDLPEIIEYTFKISDTGIGIAKEALPKIFDRFYKNKKDQYGAGIGLSLTKSLVDILGGTISVESTENKGTTFILKFSFKKASAYTDKEMNITPFVKPLPLEYQNIKLTDPIKKEDKDKDQLLIIEDNADLRNYLKDKLCDTYNIYTAKNGLKGLAKAKKIGPQIIICDVMMPKMDGFEVCREIKSTKELSHIPIILLTAKNSHVNKMEGLEQGADDYISKPFNLSELKSRIKNILSNRKLLQDKFKDSFVHSVSNEIVLNSYDEKLLSKILEIIKANVDQPNLTVEYLGKEVGLSRVHLFRKLKALTGMPPADFIRDYRLKMASELLRTKKFKIVEVAYAVGYQDVPYFSKSFKKQMGMSPSNYLKSLPKINNTLSDTK